MRRLALVLALSALCGGEALARRVPTPARPPEEPTAPAQAEQPGFWTRVAHPNQKRYDELTTQGRALFEQEKPGLAIDVLAEAARLDPARPDAWWFLGMSYQRLDRFAECADALERVHALAPEGWSPDGLRPAYPQPAFSLAFCDAAAGRLEASVELLEHALTLENLSTDATATLTYNLGDSYQALGRLEDAIRAYQRAIELHANVPIYRFSLAVALDRDEQGARAREEMLAALASDRNLSTLSQPTTTYVPPEDEDYFRGFALEVLTASDLQKSACQPWLCRSLARVYFRRFVSRAPQGPWRKRAEAHLHDLGEASPREDEINVLLGPARVDGAAQAPYVKTAMQALPRLRVCMADKPLALYRVDVFLPGKVAPPAPAPAPPKKAGGHFDIKPPVPMPTPPASNEKSITVLSAGPAAPDEGTRLCVVNALAGVKWPGPASAPARVQFALAGP
jgi:Flp pilus assembly protein TadD